MGKKQTHTSSIRGYYMVNKMVKTEVVTTKVFWKSKTFLINTLGLVGAFLMALSGELAVAGTLTVASVANIILRIVTKQGVSLKE